MGIPIMAAASWSTTRTATTSTTTRTPTRNFYRRPPDPAACRARRIPASMGLGHDQFIYRNPDVSPRLVEHDQDDGGVAGAGLDQFQDGNPHIGRLVEHDDHEGHDQDADRQKHLAFSFRPDPSAA